VTHADSRHDTCTRWAGVCFIAAEWVKVGGWVRLTVRLVDREACCQVRSAMGHCSGKAGVCLWWRGVVISLVRINKAQIGPQLAEPIQVTGNKACHVGPAWTRSSAPVGVARLVSIVLLLPSALGRISSAVSVLSYLPRLRPRSSKRPSPPAGHMRDALFLYIYLLYIYQRSEPDPQCPSPLQAVSGLLPRQ
jgi:hypothetical protein